jgi:hypothetical protein
MPKLPSFGDTLDPRHFVHEADQKLLKAAVNAGLYHAELVYNPPASAYSVVALDCHEKKAPSHRFQISWTLDLGVWQVTRTSLLPEEDCP